MTYKKQSGDKEYRLVNLRQWGCKDKMKPFQGDTVENDWYMVLEVLREDGTTQILGAGGQKSRVAWKIEGGELKIAFYHPKAPKDGPCVGHIFLTYKNRKGLRYYLPTFMVTGANKSVYTVKLGTGIDSSNFQMEGDAYFNSVFELIRA